MRVRTSAPTAVIENLYDPPCPPSLRLHCTLGPAGAVYTGSSDFYINGTTAFSGNYANLHGGEDFKHDKHDKHDNQTICATVAGVPFFSTTASTPLGRVALYCCTAVLL